jgi:hypothetical protein
LDLASKDLSLLLRSRHPLIVCETIEEQRFEALVRGVSSELTIPFWSWSAASGLLPSHPQDADRSAELGFALRLIRRTTGDGTWLLKDPMPHLEPPATLRLLRETAQEFAGSSRTLVMVGPSMPPKPELEDIQVRFDFALPGPEELRELLGRVARRYSKENPTARVALTRADAEGIVADLQGLTMFEAERALSRALVEDNALTAEDRPRIRETKKTLVEGGGLLEFVPAPGGLDQLGGLTNLKRWIATRRVGFLPDGGGKPLDPPRGSCCSASRAAARASPRRRSRRRGSCRSSRWTPASSSPRSSANRRGTCGRRCAASNGWRRACSGSTSSRRRSRPADRRSRTAACRAGSSGRS